MSEDRCISCGSIIPEGSFTCPVCEKHMTANEVVKWCAENSKSAEHGLIYGLLMHCGKQGTRDLTEDDREKANEFVRMKERESIKEHNNHD